MVEVACAPLTRNGLLRCTCGLAGCFSVDSRLKYVRLAGWARPALSDRAELGIVSSLYAGEECATLVFTDESPDRVGVVVYAALVP